MNNVADTSSDEDDPYTNSVALLRALKKRRFETLSSDDSIEQQMNNEEINSKEINGKEVNSKEINSKEINGKEINDEDILTHMCIEEISYKGMQTRSSMRLPINLEYSEVEEITGQIPVTSKDIIALSDDDPYNEDDNYEINVKVYWRSNRLDRLTMHRHDSFKKIFQHYADLEKVSVNEVLIMKGDKIINHTDTPASLKLSIIDILDGGIVNPGMNTLSKDESNDENICTIKVQTANKKQSLTIPLKKDEQFKVLIANCAKELGVTENNLKLYFDGEQISPTDTPESLDLEDEACIDLHISM
ncbi:uncharacterized protein CG4449 isoform X2 [Solenopsis invicta]|uniref:uncharacterized protein CG4449 isoform X2 n=1 Tax=Solenopsis invicta TaxID=13686 RepID=UPI000595CF44|nr:uncharacterized protein CG4449 isoform X2 [Solenopsis invicta]